MEALKQEMAAKLLETTKELPNKPLLRWATFLGLTRKSAQSLAPPESQSMNKTCQVKLWNFFQKDWSLTNTHTQIKENLIIYPEMVCLNSHETYVTHRWFGWRGLF